MRYAGCDVFRTRAPRTYHSYAPPAEGFSSPSSSPSTHHHLTSRISADAEDARACVRRSVRIADCVLLYAIAPNQSITCSLRACATWRRRRRHAGFPSRVKIAPRAKVVSNRRTDAADGIWHAEVFASVRARSACLVAFFFLVCVTSVCSFAMSSSI